MEIGNLTPIESKTTIRFLKTIATVHGKIELTELETTCINALQKNIYLTDLNLDELSLVTPEEVENVIKDANKRLELVRAAMFLIAAENHIDENKTEILRLFADTLDVHETDLEGLEEMSHKHLEMATLDFMRRKAHPHYSITDPKIKQILKDNSLDSLWKYLMPYTSSTCKKDIELANKYKALQHYPENTVGWHLFDYYNRNNFNFPGEIDGDNPEFPMIIHDLSHVLGNYKPTPAEEMEVLAFTAGYRHGRGFDAVFQAILHFHLGLKIDAAFKPYHHKFEPEPFFEALKKGNDMNIDLFNDWDYWNVMNKDLESIRKEYNILPKVK